MEDIYGCSINYYRDGNFINGIFVVGYLDKRIEKYIGEDDKSEKIDFKVPNDKLWLNCKVLMPFLREYSESILSKNSESEIKVEFELNNFFCGCKKYIFTGKFTVDLGCVGCDWLSDNPYIHFMLEKWEYKKMVE